ncbi:MAG: tryptophan synthase subunit alpha [Melioribacteraceae bacterium]|nr:tryptophan synthase subunit alpha [Melioribacteraceae bacterium]
MSYISERIERINISQQKVLSVFLTAGFPERESFINAAKAVINNGADIIEIGVPFGDSLADGPVIQSSFTTALKNGITIKDTLKFTEEIKYYSDIPVILMSSANPVNSYGLDKFCNDAFNAGINGLILPDIPLEEHEEFYSDKFDKFDKIILTTPTSSESRIRMIDELSSGFVYCVSVVGITGTRGAFGNEVILNLERTYNTIVKNKMLIGFGIKSGEDVKTFSPYCDGVIVGSAIVKSLSADDDKFTKTSELVRELKEACR